MIVTWAWKGVKGRWRRICNIPQLENYKLSLWQKNEAGSEVFALCVMILVVSGRIFWHPSDTLSPECTDRYCGTHMIILWHLWIFLDPFWVFSDTKIWFLTPQYLYVILLQMGVLGSMYPDWIHIVPKGYVNLMAYVTRPHDWRISVARGRKTLWKKNNFFEWSSDVLGR